MDPFTANGSSVLMLRIFLLLCLCISSLWAQPPIKKTHMDPKDTPLELPKINHYGQSTGQALWRSLLLPGWGENYLGHKSRSHGLLSADLALWMGLWLSKNTAEQSLQNASSYAKRYASIGKQSQDLALLQAMNDWRSRNGSTGEASNPSPGDNYNLDQLRAGLSVDRYLPNTAEYQWDWGPSSNPEANGHYERYRNLMSTWRMSQISSQLLIGGLVAGRLISMIDVVVLSRRAKGLELSTAMTPQSLALNLKGEF